MYVGGDIDLVVIGQVILLFIAGHNRLISVLNELTNTCTSVCTRSIPDVLQPL